MPQIEGEKKRVAELETQIKAYDTRAMERRRTMGGASCAWPRAVRRAHVQHHQA